MTFLDYLTPDQRKTIISLPYRVGLWVSHSDNTGGDQARQRELLVLSNIIHGFADEMFGSEAMQYVMSETITKKDSWMEWAQNIESVPADCEFAIDVLKDHANPKDINAFRNHLLEIGEAVALAFREQKAPGARFAAYLSYVAGRMKKSRGRLMERPFQDYVRISAHEHKALAALAKALGATY